MQLTNDVKITVVSPAAAAAQTAIDSSILDMQGYEGVMFIALTGDVDNTSALTLTVKGNSANHLTVPTPITQKATTLFTADATSADSKALVVDLYKPALRYVFANLTRATANAVIGGIIAIQYKAGVKPTTNDASVIASALGLGVLA